MPNLYIDRNRNKKLFEAKSKSPVTQAPVKHKYIYSE